jgi:hypothetical protein
LFYSRRPQQRDVSCAYTIFSLLCAMMKTANDFAKRITLSPSGVPPVCTDVTE